MGNGRDDPDRMLFGKQLRKMREKREQSRDELGTAIGNTGSTIANIETGYRAPTTDQARALDDFFDLPGTFQDLEERLHGLPFSAGFRPFAPYEAEALALKLYEPLLVPGLLQAPDYARSILETHPDATPEVVEERLAGRLERQKVLEKANPPKLWVLLDKAVLEREIGSRKIMADQIRHLIDATRRPGVTVQVITETTHCGLSGAFALAETPGRRAAYIETIVDGTLTEDQSVVSHLDFRFDTLRTEAQRGRDSLVLMERVLDTWTDTD